MVGHAVSLTVTLTQTMNTTEQDDEISLRDLIDILWQGRWTIVLVPVVLTVLAGVTALLQPPTYRATVVVSPVSNKPGGGLNGLGSLTSRLGGFAALAGISVGGDSNRAETIAAQQFFRCWNLRLKT